MPISTLTSKGQVTIPKEIRSRMGLKTGTGWSFASRRRATSRCGPPGS